MTLPAGERARRQEAAKEQLLATPKRHLRHAMHHHLSNVQDDSMNSSGTHSALMIAAHKGRADIVTALLNSLTINVNQANIHGDTALIVAVRSGDLPTVQTLLRAPSIQVNHANHENDTALCVAEKYNHSAIAQALIDAGGRREPAPQ